MPRGKLIFITGGARSGKSSFATEKIDEINIISRLFHNDELLEDEKIKIEKNSRAIKSRKTSSRIHNKGVQERVKRTEKIERSDEYEERIKTQKAMQNYPELATTTIGSYPQTPEIRKLRRGYKNGLISQEKYETEIKE